MDTIHEDVQHAPTAHTPVASNKESAFMDNLQSFVPERLTQIIPNVTKAPEEPQVPLEVKALECKMLKDLVDDLKAKRR